MDLVDSEISCFAINNVIGIEPFSLESVQPNSYDVHLGDSFVLITLRHIVNGDWDLTYLPYPDYPVDVRDPESLDRLKRDGYAHEFTSQSVVLYPGDFLLGTTLEVISLPDCIKAQIDGKSSLARWGITIHQTGGFIDAGFCGEITLEITNELPVPVKIHATDPIAQISFTLTKSCKVPYNKKKGAKYMKQRGATASMYHKNFIPVVSNPN